MRYLRCPIGSCRYLSPSAGSRSNTRHNKLYTTHGILSQIYHRSVKTSSLGSHAPVTVPNDADASFHIQLHDDSFSTHLCDAPELQVSVTKNLLLQLYQQMATMRRMEMAADALYKAKLIRGFCHLAIGQEAISVGMEAAMDEHDRVITAYRCHPFAVLRGGSVTSVLSELLGRRNGISNGKGGSMHMFTKSFFGGNGIVGAQVPVGAGIAFAQKYNNTPGLTFALYGDGASNQGQVFEAYNMAKLWNLPCIFVCENNKYGMGTPAEKSSMNVEYHKRGDVIPGLQVNAMDVLAVLQACRFAKKWVEDDNGPLVMQMVTYRYGGHSMSDPGTTYRTREEIQDVRAHKDTITGLAKRLIEWSVCSETDIKDMDKAAKKEVDEAVEEAKKSAEPDVKELATDIYVKGSQPQYMRGREREELLST